MAALNARIRAIGFDLDGTLVDTMGDLAAAVNLMLGMLNARTLPEERISALVGNGVEALVAGALRASLGEHALTPEQSEAALELFRRQYARNLFTRSRVYPGVIPALQKLTALRLPLCCITNKESQFSVPLLEQAQLTPLLAFALCGDRAEDRKPRPRMLLAACSRLSITPGELLYVGDSNVDITAARAAGCPVLAVTYGYGKARTAQLQPDGVVGKLTDLLPMLQHSADTRRGISWEPTGTMP